MVFKAKKPVLVDIHWIDILWSPEMYDPAVERKWRYMNFDVPETVQRFAIEVLRPHVHSLDYKEVYRLKESLRYGIHCFRKNDWQILIGGSQDTVIPVGKDIRESIILIWMEVFDDAGFKILDLSNYVRVK